MRILPAAAALTMIAGTAHADIPFFTATCPGGIAVHAEEGGPVTVDGTEADIVSETKYGVEARGGDVTVVMMIKPDGSLSVTMPQPDGGTGVCLIDASGPIQHDEQL
jgi:hypothetical protein